MQEEEEEDDNKYYSNRNGVRIMMQLQARSRAMCVGCMNVKVCLCLYVMDAKGILVWISEKI